MKFLAVLMALVVAGCVAVAAPDESDGAATVRLEYTDGGVCSGTAVGSHTILTATHCQEGAPLWTVNGVVAEVEEQIDDGNDHSLLIVNIELQGSAAWNWLPQNVLKQGDHVTYYGNPGGLPSQYREGVVSGFYEDKILLDINGWKGDSGAGVFKGDRLVAVVSGIYERGPFGLMVALPLKFTDEQRAKIR